MTVELLNIKLEDIELVDRAREEYDVVDLVDSIREKGVIQPITVTRLGGGNYRVLAGGRRYTAATECELATIPCIVREEGTALDNKEIEFLENAQRKGLNWKENMTLVSEIHALFIEKHGKWGSQTKTAKFLDRSVGGIKRILDLKDMCDKFPLILDNANEDQAVKKARQIEELIVVKLLQSKHKEAAAELGLEPEQDLAEITEQAIGEGFQDDDYVTRCRRAQHHFVVGDALEGLSEMITEGLTPPISLCEVDPPYGIDLVEQKKGESVGIEDYEEIAADKYDEWTQELIIRLNEVLPDNCRIIYWCGQDWIPAIQRAMDDVNWSYDPLPCIWSKGSGQTNDPERYLARTYETFIVAAKGEGVPLAKRGRANVFNYDPVPSGSKYHPTQKPIALLEEILRTFGWPGSILMCPFLGSGVTIRAAYRLNMMPFGWDLNPDNKEKFLAAIETDIQKYKTGGDSNAGDDVPF